MRTNTGGIVQLSELLTIEQTVQDKAIYHKNQKPVVYVLADVGGPGAEQAESPVYGVLGVGKKLESFRPEEGYQIEQYYTSQPWSEERLAMKWDGEWHITYETFRDMGIAFAVAMLLIYLLIVGQFQSFVTPLIIMAPIPLTLIGILPGHWMTGSYFTATSMIGFIALAGIIVRNSILLVDFIQLQERAGVSLSEAVIKAGAIRTRPILLTAAALMVGAFVIILDPIFQGLAVSLLFGVGAVILWIIGYWIDNPWLSRVGLMGAVIMLTVSSGLLVSLPLSGLLNRLAVPKQDLALLQPPGTKGGVDLDELAGFKA